MAVAVAKADVEYSIKPEAVTPAIPTSEWPLLLQNYDKRGFLFPLIVALSTRPFYIYPAYSVHMRLTFPSSFSPCENRSLYSNS